MMHQGAKFATKRERIAAELASLESKAPPIDGDAYRIAKANKHKPWARRWLKANGHWF